MAGNRKLANIGKAVDSAANGDFLGLNDSGGIFKDVQWDNITGKPTVLDSAATISLIDSAYVQARQTDVGIDSAAITSLVDSAYVQLRVSAGGLDSSLTTGLIDSAYISARVTSGLDSSGTLNLVDSDYISSRATASSGFSTFKYTATAGQTTFDSTDANGNTLSYTADGILVFYNGILMLPTYDYTATDGTSVVLTVGADSGSVITIGEWALGSSSSSAAAGLYGDRALVVAGTTSPTGQLNTMDYFSISALSGTATDFGDLSSVKERLGACSDTIYGVFMGGQYNTGSWIRVNTIDYVTIATTGNVSDFGDLNNIVANNCATSDGTYGFSFGGTDGNNYYTQIDYITIQTTGNAQDFGDITQDPILSTAFADTTRALRAGGFVATGGVITNTIDYITTSTPGNAVDFGDMTVSRYAVSSAADTTRGVVGVAENTTDQNTLDYVTIQTTGNATDFGDLTQSLQKRSATSDGTYGVFSGGGNPSTAQSDIEYITIQTTGNASDFGDLSVARMYPDACSGLAA
jgi:hypothetical protein